MNWINDLNCSNYDSDTLSKFVSSNYDTEAELKKRILLAREKNLLLKRSIAENILNSRKLEDERYKRQHHRSKDKTDLSSHFPISSSHFPATNFQLTYQHDSTPYQPSTYSLPKSMDGNERSTIFSSPGPGQQTDSLANLIHSTSGHISSHLLHSISPENHTISNPNPIQIRSSNVETRTIIFPPNNINPKINSPSLDLSSSIAPLTESSSDLLQSILNEYNPDSVSKAKEGERQHLLSTKKYPLKDKYKNLKELKQIKPSIVSKPAIATVSPVFNDEFESLLADISKLINETQTSLAQPTLDRRSSSVSGLSTDPNLSDSERLLKVQQQTYKKINKQMIKSLVQASEEDFRIPLWRHHLRGQINPDPALIMKPLTIFKCVGWAMLSLICYPQVAIKRRRLATREHQRDDLAGTLVLYQESMGQWIGKLLKPVLQSITQDTSLDFHLSNEELQQPISKRNRAGGSKILTTQQKILQLKVRVKYIVSTITGNSSTSSSNTSSSDGAAACMPPPHLTKFLASLTEDGLYFKDHFLYDCEKECLEFDSYGATKGLVKILDSPPIQLVTNLADNANPSTSTKGNIINVRDEWLDVSLFRIFLKNFLFIRIIICRVLLCPWSVGIGHFPQPLVDRTQQQTGRGSSIMLQNFRILASTFYEMIRIRDTSKVPPIPSDNDVVREYKRIEDKSLDKEDQTSKSAFSGFSVGGLLSSIASSRVDREREREKAVVAAKDRVQLSLRDAFESLDKIHYLLVPMSGRMFQASDTSENWMSDLSLQLEDWLDKIVIHVLLARADKKNKH